MSGASAASVQESHGVLTGRSARCGAAVLELHSSSECSFSRVTRSLNLRSRLARDLGTVRSGFSAGRLFAEVVNRASGELERMAAQAGRGSPEGDEATSTGHLESLAEHYTMQMERNVHDTVTRGSAEVAAPAEEPAFALQDGDLGDNVELF